MAGPQIHAFSIVMPPRRLIGLHRHEFHEVFYCAAGTGTQWRDDVELPMRAGDLFLFPAGVRHAGAGDRGNDCLGIVCYVHDRAFAEVSEGDADGAAVLAALCRHAQTGGARVPLSPPGRRLVDGILRRLGEEARDRAIGYRCALKLLFAEFLLVLLRDPATVEFMHAVVPPVTAHDQIGDVRRYLDVHFREPVRVDDMADLAGLSRSHFHAVFKRETGTTLTGYLQTLRVSEAQRLLQTGDDDVIAVAFASGFASLSHFYEVFGKRVGCSPKAYRTRCAAAV